MPEEERRNWATPIAWALVSVVFFVSGMFLGEELLAYLSFVAAGIAIASGVRTYKSGLYAHRPDTELKRQLAQLQARLADAEGEIERLRAEADFDRKLLRPSDDN